MSVSKSTSARKGRPGCGDERRLLKTKTPGVFKRVDAKGRTMGYVCVFRAGGRQRKRHARTYEEAKRAKCESETDRDRGELQERTAITFRVYLDEWVERYRGQGRRGFRENTRDEYRRLIGAFAHPYFPARLKLIDVSPYVLARFVDWLADEKVQGRRLGDRTIANATMPLRAALAAAKREGLIRHNPAQGLSLPPRDEPAGEEVKVFTPEQLAAVMGLAPERHRLLLELLAATGLRISEAIALQRLHVQLDSPAPEVCIRRVIVNGRTEPPKTKYSRREVRLPASLAKSLRDHLAAQPDHDSTAPCKSG
jgi:integrase